MKFVLVNSSSTISLTMPGDSSRQYIVVSFNVVVISLVGAGKVSRYDSVAGGGFSKYLLDFFRRALLSCRNYEDKLIFEIHSKYLTQ